MKSALKAKTRPLFFKADEFSNRGGGGNRTRVRKGSQTPSTIISCVYLFKTFVTHRRVSTRPIRLENLDFVPQWPGIKSSRFCLRSSQCLPAESAEGPSQQIRLRVPVLRWQLMFDRFYNEALRSTSNGRWMITLPVETRSPPIPSVVVNNHW